ncbi:hypothetical protein WIV_gp118 [Wiseana iridescent virus]|uniref:Uncharacterized protein n=1 Tax=Wiseana iridescent virus TaxID=68347 RepID=G0T5E4_IRV9|nr:hypothetical protein WIV_gp118 [Wiseana iridescent virus]ADO00462.1 hypothetical protein [Wiseana iridescent virus]
MNRVVNILSEEEPLKVNQKVGTTTLEIEDESQPVENKVKQPKKIVLWKTYNFWVEMAIFIISVVGAIFIAYNSTKGFLLWFVSNTMCMVYFFVRKQYPLALQQLVFLGTTILGIVNNFQSIF